ncbi:MAG: hypothetical protein ACRDWA_07620 [Acidimicrobiia bacterium]
MSFPWYNVSPSERKSLLSRVNCGFKFARHRVIACEQSFERLRQLNVADPPELAGQFRSR